MLKSCYNCKQTLENTQFSVDRSKKDGLSIYCRACKKIKKSFRLALGLDLETDRKRYWNDPEKMRAKWKRLNPPEKERRRNRNPKRAAGKNFRACVRRKTDPEFKIKACLRTRINTVVRKEHKKARSAELLGCSIDQFLGHLEINFQEGMTWENYGPVWHVDHVRPCASFDLTCPQQQRECFNWKNLQPLFAEDNLRKGAKFERKEG